MSRLVFTGLCLVLVFTQWAFAGVHFWAYSLMSLALYALCVIFTARCFVLSLRPGDQNRLIKLRRPSLAVVFLLLFLGLTGVQLIPLPLPIVDFLSPQAAQIYARVQEVTTGSKDSFTLSLVPYSTKIALFQAVAFTCAFVLTQAVVNSRSRVRFLAGFLVMMGLFQVLYGMYETYAAGQESIWWWPKEFGRGYVTGTYMYKNSLAFFLEMAIPLTFGLALSFAGRPEKRAGYALLGTKSGAAEHNRRSSAEDGSRHARQAASSWEGHREEAKKKVYRFKVRAHGEQRAPLLKKIKDLVLGIEDHAQPLLWSFLGIILGVGMLLTASRGGIVSLVIGACCAGGMFFFKAGYRRMAGIVFIACLAIFLYALSVGIHKTVERFERFDLGWEGRLKISQAAWPMVWDYPVLGTGLSTFEHVFPTYAPPDLMRRTYLNAHNDWLQVAIETGLVGFVLVFVGYVWFLAVAIRQWFRRRDPLAVGLGGGMIMALVSIGIHSLVDFNMHIPANALSTMVVAGLGWNALFLRTRRT
jgi:hypothetical protein